MIKTIFRRSKNRLGRKKGSIGILIGIILVLGGYNLVGNNAPTLAEKCNTLFEEQKNSMASQNWDLTSRQIKKQLDECSGVFGGQDKVVLLHNGAVSSFMLGDKGSAKKYAEEGLIVNNTLTNDQRSLIPYQSSLITTMVDIRNDVYYPVVSPEEAEKSQNNAEKLDNL
jgi:hypothetical protein